MKKQTLSIVASTMMAFGTSIGFSNLELGSPSHTYKRKRDKLPDEEQKMRIIKAQIKRNRKAER